MIIIIVKDKNFKGYCVEQFDFSCQSINDTILLIRLNLSLHF